LRANITEVVVLGGVVIVAGPELLPLLPAAILYINLATDGLPALALGLSPPDRDIMQRPPRDPTESIFSRDVRLLVLLGVLVECPIFLWIYFSNHADIEVARTEVFLLFVFVELIISTCFRSLRFSVFQAPPHKWLLLAMAWEIALLGVLIQFEVVRETFGIRMPTWPDIGMALAVSAFVVAAIEATKAYLRATTGKSVARRTRLSETGKVKVPLPEQTAETVEEATRTAVPGALLVGVPQEGADPASIVRQVTGANTMVKILIPVGGTPNDRFAVQSVIKRFMNDTAMEVHLVNVQRPFSAYVAQFSSRRNRLDYHREQAEKALAPARATLDKFSIPYAVHMEVGDRATAITDTARRLGCDEIVMATARKNSLTRLVENSITDRVIELTPVPVEVIAGDSMSKWERYGIPAAIAAGLAMALAIED
jgi:nucleotide-binding universal stress UspA family protein